MTTDSVTVRPAWLALVGVVPPGVEQLLADVRVEPLRQTVTGVPVRFRHTLTPSGRGG